MVEVALNPCQEGGFGFPYHYMIPYYSQLIYSAMVEMAFNPFQEGGFGIPSES